MTDEQRIKSILTETEHCYISYGNLHDEDEQGVRLIDKALKKQLPVKVERSELRPTEWGSLWRCPECDADLIKVEFYREDGLEPEQKNSWCWSCGQKLDWSVEE